MYNLRYTLNVSAAMRRALRSVVAKKRQNGRDECSPPPKFIEIKEITHIFREERPKTGTLLKNRHLVEFTLVPKEVLLRDV